MTAVDTASHTGRRTLLEGGLMDRRSFLKRAAVTATAAVPFTAFMQRAAAQEPANAVRRGQTAGYGPLFPVEDQTTGLPLLLLPRGFRYVSFGWTGDPLDNGLPTPAVHDGMASFAAGRGRIRLVRNHEVGAGAPFSSAYYNSAAGGGTTTLEFDTQKGEVVSMRDSISGTVRNCAGGPTPWGTWLTCEETTTFLGGMPHGYIFEVPADGLGDPLPLRDMGRFSHEAIAVDPSTGYVYETEDAGTSSGLYRFTPATPGQLSDGGLLSMLKIKNINQANLGTSYAHGATFDVEWVPIANPDAPGAIPGNFVWAQGRALGAATFARLEGCWYGNDAKIYVVSTSGGIGQGQIWEYDPAGETIRLLFQVAGRGRVECARQHHRQPTRWPRAVRRRQRRRVHAWTDRRRRHLPVCQEQRRPQRRKERLRWQLHRVGMGWRLLQPGRAVAVRQPAEPGDYLRHHRAVDVGGALGFQGS
jgi:secreted PhoX family phosphatase